MQNVASRSAHASRGQVSSLIGTSNPSLLQSLFPSIKTWQKIGVAVLFIGLLVVFGRARFYLPENPVPITLQTFGVLMTGSVLGWRWGLLSILGWYLLGVAGVAVFQGGGGGWAYVSGQTSVTGGFLIGFILCTGLVGFFSQRGWTHGKSLWPMLLAGLLIYLPGLLFWASVSESLNFDNLFTKGMYPYIPGDLVKLMMASAITGLLWSVADRRSR